MRQEGVRWGVRSLDGEGKEGEWRGELELDKEEEMGERGIGRKGTPLDEKGR